MEILSYPYRAKPWIMLLGCAFFGSGALFMGHEAMVNDRGLVINGLIHLEPNGATTFFWFMAASCAVFVAIAVSGVFSDLFFSHRVVLTSTDISAPRFPFLPKTTVVKLSEIKGLSVHSIRQSRFLDIQHVHGKLTITSAFLPDEAAFDKLHSDILKHSRALSPHSAASTQSLVKTDTPSRIDTTGTSETVATWVWRNLVPESGQAASVQGELLRSVERLRHEAQGNGNINWNPCFVMFVNFLRDNLLSQDYISSVDGASISQDLDRLLNFVPPDELMDERDFDDHGPYIKDDLYDRLTAHVVEFCRQYPQVIPKPYDPDQSH